MRVRFGCTSSRSLRAALVVAVFAVLHPQAFARPQRVAMIPNGQVFSCANCHVNPAGGGARNGFGLAVQAITGTSLIAFWSPNLAALDSDGDGFTNGEELGDPDGDGTAIPGSTVTNPGNAASKPVIPPPDFLPITLLPGGQLVGLSWSSGRPPFLVQVKSSLADPLWQDVLTTSNRTATVALSGGAGFFRVVDHTAGSSGISPSPAGADATPPATQAAASITGD